MLALAWSSIPHCFILSSFHPVIFPSPKTNQRSFLNADLVGFGHFFYGAIFYVTSSNRMLPVAKLWSQSCPTEHTASTWAMFCDGGFFPSPQKHGLVIIPDGTPNGDVNHEPVVGAITVVSQEAAQVLESAGEGPLGKMLPAAMLTWIHCPIRLLAYSYPILDNKNNTRAI